MSGRRTSLSHVLSVCSLEGKPPVIDPHEAYEFPFESATSTCHILARVSTVRSHLYYKNPTDLELDSRIATEIDWLCEADGFVFVLDSQWQRSLANTEAFSRLKMDLASRNLVLETIPIVFQLNKRDIKSIMPRDVAQVGFPVDESSVYVESVASKGIGTLEAVAQLVLLMDKCVL